MQGLEAVAQEIADPMRKELQRVFTEVRLGRPVEDALGDAADRMDSNDLRWTVMAIRIQREVGGNLAVLLDTVERHDDQARARPPRAPGAHGRRSAVGDRAEPRLADPRRSRSGSSSRRTCKPLFHDFLGIVGLIVAVVLSIVGWFWLRRIVDIEV